MNNYFEGLYFKHQKDNVALALIPGVSDEGAFIQVLTNNRAYNIPFDLSDYKRIQNNITIGKNTFSPRGIDIDIDYSELNLKGSIEYSNITPIKYDIMGPFKYFNMECRHAIISMHHNLKGSVELDGDTFNFSGGTGYIEGDSGKSFPEKYTWVQCNLFSKKCSVMVSIAVIPFAGFKFTGCISIIYYGDKEYRLATYKGVRILKNNKSRLEIKQGRYTLAIEILDKGGFGLFAPNNGSMSRIIHETPACSARFLFKDKNKIIFDMVSDSTSFEFVE